MTGPKAGEAKAEVLERSWRTEFVIPVPDELAKTKKRNSSIPGADDVPGTISGKISK